MTSPKSLSYTRRVEPAVVYETRDLASVNDAISEVEKGEVDARLVFDFGAGTPTQQAERVLTEEREKPSEQPTGEVGSIEVLFPAESHVGV